MTAQQVARLWQQRASRAETEFRFTTRAVGEAAVKFTKGELTAGLYAIPEDRSPTTGRKKWQRTGKLRAAERYEVRDAYTVAILNDTSYAEPRHAAGKPGRRKINPVREQHWRDDLEKTFLPLMTDFYDLTIRKIMGQP